MSLLQKSVLLVVLIAGLGAAAWVGMLRAASEQDNNNVALEVDYDDVVRAAALAGDSPEDLLTDLKAAGATHVAITEVSLGELADTGKLWSATRGRIIPLRSLSPSASQRVIEQVEAKLPTSGPQSYQRYDQLRDLSTQVGELGIGYDEAVEVAKAAGLKMIARPRPDFVNTPRAVDASIKAAADIGAEAVVFAGTQVLGYKGLLEYAAQKMQAVGLQFGYIELAPQAGEDALAAHLNYQSLRVHSISDQELARMSRGRAIDRFSLAVRERKVRLCYVHLLFTESDPLGSNVNVDYVKSLAGRLRDDGFNLGTPGPFAPVSPPPWALPLIFAAIGVALMWLVQSVVGLSRPWFWAVTAGVLLAAAASGVSQLAPFRPLVALAAALVFPIWALLGVHFPERPTRHPVLNGALAFLRITVISAMGGLLVAGCLTAAPYLANIEQFRGVKLAQLLPLLIVASVFVTRSTRRYWEVRTELGQAKGEAPALKAGLAEVLNTVVRYWHALAVVLGLALVAVLVLRSGNESGLGISTVEVELRALLDRLLLVRPRSKEILFAHPLLILSLILLRRGARRGLWIGLTAGVIGQVSIINTFCHLHTPLVISLLRVVHGLWIGLAGGLLLWLVVWWVGGLNRRAQQ